MDKAQTTEPGTLMPRANRQWRKAIVRYGGTSSRASPRLISRRARCWTSAAIAVGFLRLLHALKPFRHAIGVDIAVNSIAAARALAGVSPIDYEIAPDLTTWPLIASISRSATR